MPGLTRMTLLATLCCIPLLGNTQIPDFALTNVVNGSVVSLSTFPSCSGVVIIFTSNTCPYDEYYRKRISKLSVDYHDKVPVLLVNASPDPAESIDKMKAKAEQLGLNVPYLADKEQIVMQSLGATKSPQAFLLKNDAGKFSVVYRGAIDDNAQVDNDVRHAYLRDAIDILLNNQQIATNEVRPVGCTIRKK
jgi:peroxiredoxin